MTSIAFFDKTCLRGLQVMLPFLLRRQLFPLLPNPDRRRQGPLPTDARSFPFIFLCIL